MNKEVLAQKVREEIKEEGALISGEGKETESEKGKWMEIVLVGEADYGAIISRELI